MSDKIFDTFVFSGKSINCYGLEIVKRNLLTHGIICQDFSFKNKNDILFSMYWPEQIFDFVKWRYNSNLKNRKIIIGGNTATANPSILTCFDCLVYLGDGELWNGQLDSEFIVSKNNDSPKNIAISKRISPLHYEDIQDNKRTFIEMSRGCKNKCLFCQYGWLKPYRECDIIDLKSVINLAKTKSVRMFAADRFQHSRYEDLRIILNNMGKCDTGSDVSLKFLLQNPDYLKLTSKVRVGIEGMSTRLRQLIGKNYTDEDIINFCDLVAKAGIKCLDFYMIYGLPTEREEDINSFKNLLERLDEILPDNYVICIHWNAFTPSSQTPFQWMRSAYDYDCKKMQLVLMEKRFTKRIKIMHKPRFTSNTTIIFRMLAIRGSEKNAKLIFNISKNMSYFKTHPELIISEFKKESGFDLLSELPDDFIFPWDRFVRYKKEAMLHYKNLNLRKYS